jgi:hypothetical protein
VQNNPDSQCGEQNGTAQPVAATDWAKEIKVFRFDRDIVEKFGLKAARFVTYLECWLHGKFVRGTGCLQYTYDPARVICQRTGLKPATLERIVKTLRKAEFIRVKHVKKNMRSYALPDAEGYYESREGEKRVFALRRDADAHGEPVAILLYNLRHWAGQNHERVRLFKGRYWRHDTLKDLVFQFTGILTEEQLRDAIRYLVEKKLAEVIAFYDMNGARSGDRFWITLLENPPVDDYEPQNNVRPASMFTLEGVRQTVGSTAENQRISGDKTALPFDKTPLPNDKTESDESSPQPLQSTGVAGNGHPPLSITSLSAPPDVAGAPSGLAQARVNANLPQSANSARPSAFRKPSASSAERPTAGDSSALNLRLGELEAKVASLTRNFQNLNLSIRLDKTRSTAKGGEIEQHEDIVLRIPRSSQRNFLHQFKLDNENAAKKTRDADIGERFGLNEELRRYNLRQTPMDCFSHRFGDPRLACKSCAWSKSCEIGTPVEIMKAIQSVSILHSPGWNELRETDQPENVADTYRDAYKEVFGVDAPDAVGKAARIYQHAQSLRLPVRYYCLIYMTIWARTNPMQKFYSNYLSGDRAFNMVRMVLDLCKQEVATVLEDRLAMVLHVKFVGGKPLWRHQPTPAERFMEGWLDACKDHGQPEYEFKRQEVRELAGYTDEFRLGDIENMLESAREWLLETTGEKSLMGFLCHVQDRPLPQPEVDLWESKPPEYEHLIDDEEAYFDPTRSREYWEANYPKYRAEQQMIREAEERAKPDSGSEYLEEILGNVHPVDQSSPNGST